MAQPLAARMRPRNLDEIVGQDHLLGPGSALRRLVDDGETTSIFLWGPPGVGKSTIAYAIAQSSLQGFFQISATAAGVRELRQVIAQAESDKEQGSTGTILFVDEIHRFSKAQQDILLPAVEEGVITLIAATTENPSFSVVAPLLSRSLLLTLNPLTATDIRTLIGRALTDPRGLDKTISIKDEAMDDLVRLAGGDARRALTYLEEAAGNARAKKLTAIDLETVIQSAPKALARYDKDGDQHYDIISAFIKSLRGSDVNAALHWLARMVDAGEDPRYIARRLVVHASEDVGMADPSVLPLAIAAAQAVQLVGMPEAGINLAHATIAVATAPKSNAVIRGYNRALADVKAGITGAVPLHLRDSHYSGAKDYGHGVGYLYPHDFPHNVVDQSYLPEGYTLRADQPYYQPTLNGFEHTITKRLIQNQIYALENNQRSTPNDVD